MRTPLLLGLVLLGVSLAVACVVEPLRYDWLACSKTGDCATGYGCYAVSQLSSGVCLQDGNGLEPFKVGEPSVQEPIAEKEATSEEKAAEPVAEKEATPEDAGGETAPEEASPEMDGGDGA